MKKLLILSFIAVLGVLPISAQAQQSLTINGEKVEKVVTKISFDGDNVILFFNDNTKQEADMGTVRLSFFTTTDIHGIEAFQLKNVVGNQITLGELPANTEVFIYDISGKMLLRTFDKTINVRSLKSGIYTLRAGNQIVKFTKR